MIEMGAAREKQFTYSGADYSEADICNYLNGRGIRFRKARRMAYDALKVPASWPLRGYAIDGYDLSFEPPVFDVVRKLAVGHVDLAAEFQAKNYKASLALFEELRREFELRSK